MADTSLDLQKLKVPDLKKMLKEKRLSTVGNKSELIERLQGHPEANEVLDSSGKDILLEDDDDSHDDITVAKATPAVTEKKLTKLAAPLVKPTSKPPAVAETKVTKPVLNKITMSSSNGAPAATANGGKMEQRLKRFGVVSPDAKKVERAERFQLSKLVTTITSTSSEAKSPTIVSTPTPSGALLQKRIDRFGVISATSTTTKVTGQDVDLLKKRAQRFGAVTSTSLVKVDEQERVQKRKARFGTVIAGSISTDAPEAKKKRAERFGLATA